MRPPIPPSCTLVDQTLAGSRTFKITPPCPPHDFAFLFYSVNPYCAKSLQSVLARSIFSPLSPLLLSKTGAPYGIEILCRVDFSHLKVPAHPLFFTPCQAFPSSFRFFSFLGDRTTLLLGPVRPHSLQGNSANTPPL